MASNKRRGNFFQGMIDSIKWKVVFPRAIKIKNKSGIPRETQ